MCGRDRPLEGADASDLRTDVFVTEEEAEAWVDANFDRYPDGSISAPKQGAAPRAEGLTHESTCPAGQGATAGCTCRIRVAAPRAEGLDVERLARAVEASWVGSYTIEGHSHREVAEAIAVEYRWAAPRAEGLDVDWLAEQMLLIDGNHNAFVARVHAERLLPRIVARLFRPSDERVSESEEPR